jgi:hypothetical protein
MKDKLTTKVHSEQVAPHDAKRLLPAVFSWATFKKRNPNIPIYSCTDGTLGIKYTVEPTMRNLGYRQITINETNALGIPHSVDDKPKKFVIDWLSKNTEYHNYKDCVFYVWHVRREYATRCIDVFLK